MKMLNVYMIIITTAAAGWSSLPTERIGLVRTAYLIQKLCNNEISLPTKWHTWNYITSHYYLHIFIDIYCLLFVLPIYNKMHMHPGVLGSVHLNFLGGGCKFSGGVPRQIFYPTPYEWSKNF